MNRLRKWEFLLLLAVFFTHFAGAQKTAMVVLRLVARPVQSLTISETEQLTGLDNDAENNAKGTTGEIADKKQLHIYSAGAFTVKASNIDSFRNENDKDASIFLNTSLSPGNKRTASGVTLQKNVKLGTKGFGEIIAAGPNGTSSSFDIRYNSGANGKPASKIKHPSVLYTIEPN